MPILAPFQKGHCQKLARLENRAKSASPRCFLLGGTSTAAVLLPLRAAHTIEQSQPLLAVQHR